MSEPLYAVGVIGQNVVIDCHTHEEALVYVDALRATLDAARAAQDVAGREVTASEAYIEDFGFDPFEPKQPVMSECAHADRYNHADNPSRSTCRDCGESIIDAPAARLSHDRGADARLAIKTLGEQKAYQAGWDAGRADALGPSMELVPAPTPHVPGCTLPQTHRDCGFTPVIPGRALSVPAPTLPALDALMDAEHRYCVEVNGEYALRHSVEVHRSQAEFILEALRDAV